ncbi:MAG: type II secretion system protein GspG [Acidobacteriota bacterium]|nr:type II secretion system protein GspG [Acidobacteriota bacterium]
MKRLLIAALLITFAVPMFAEDAPPTKAQLVASIVKLLDVRTLAAQAYMLTRAPLPTADDPVGQHLDYARLGQEVYTALLTTRFSADELRELLEFCRTKTGQKVVATLVDVGEVSTFVLSSETLRAAMDDVQREQATKAPAKKTMADMRLIASAAEARATDTEEFPVTDIYGLKLALEPVYVKTLPVTDAWGTPFHWVSDGKQYRVVSAGADKRFEMHSRDLAPGVTTSRPTDDADADLIFQDGEFVQFPKGSQQ